MQTSMLGIAKKAKSDKQSLAAEVSIHEEPGAGNRTPGSVRGLSGNWQSYRDQFPFDANDGNAQFLPTVARSALVRQVESTLGLRIKRDL